MFFAERVASRCRAPNRADDQADEKREGKTGSDLHEARRSYVRFRNLLRSDPEEAARYEARKLQLAERFPHDRKRCTAGKDELIAQLLGE